MEQQLISSEDAESRMVTCQNCEKSYEEGANFCPHCGQKTNDDLTIGVLFYNTISNYFSFDARFLKSFFPLMFRPGYLATKFIQGKRLLYLHPAQMYLFVSVIFFFIISFSTRDLVSKADEINQQVADSEIIDEFSEEAKVVIDSVVTEEAIKRGILDSVAINNALDKMGENPELYGLDQKNKAIVDSIIKSKLPIKDKDFIELELDEPIVKSTDSVSFNNPTTTWNFDRKKIDSLIEVGANDQTIYKSMGMPDDAGYFKRRLFKNVLNLYKGKGAGSIVQAFFDSIPLAMFFLLPIFALILKIFYFNKGKYAHHLVFSFYYFSFLFTVFAIVFAVNRFLYDIPDWIDWLIALSTYLYFLVALIKFYRQNWFLSFVKCNIISIVFLLMVIPMTFVVLAGFSFLFY
jgi:hypothetical protein